MDTKRRLGAIAVLAVVMSGTAASAGQSAPRPAPKEAQTPPSETFILKPGEAKNLVVKEAVRSRIEDPEIVNVAVPTLESSKTIFHMTGSKVGKTTMTVWSKDGTSKTYEIIVEN